MPPRSILRTIINELGQLRLAVAPSFPAVPLWWAQVSAAVADTTTSGTCTAPAAGAAGGVASAGGGSAETAADQRK